jgi:hypothetical protein
MMQLHAPTIRTLALIGVLGFRSLLAQDTQQTNPNSTTSTTPSNTTGAASKFPAPEPEKWNPPGPTKLKFVSIGFRLPILIHTDIEKRSTTATVSSNNPTTTTTTSFDTTPKSSRLAIGLALEFPVYHHLTLVGEGLYHVLRYQQIENITQVVSAGTNSTNVTQNTKARQLTFPVMLRYTGFKHGGVLSKIFVAGGVEFVRISNLKSQTDTSYTAINLAPVNSTSYAPVAANLRSTSGPTVGLGFKFLDSFNIRLTPEVRYTKLRGRIFNTGSSLSREQQLEAGFALTF